MSQHESNETRANLGSAAVMVFFTTLALLMLQILQTVTLSLQIFHNTAFFVISVCMFGLGGGGSLAAYMRHRGWAVTQRTLWIVSLAFACSVLGAGLLNSRISDLEGIIFTSVLPYVFVGLLLPMIFQTWPRHAGRIYFFDLVGSGFGSYGADRGTLASSAVPLVLVVVERIARAGSTLQCDGLPRYRRSGCCLPRRRPGADASSAAPCDPSRQ